MSCTRQSRISLISAILPLCWALAACAETGTSANVADDVLATQAERFRAIVAADLPALDAILASDLVYTHSHGGIDSKAAFMQSLGSGAVDYLELTPRNSQVRVYDVTAVVTGEVYLRVEAGGQEHEVSMRFTEVYVYSDDRWQLVAWQSTRIP